MPVFLLTTWFAKPAEPIRQLPRDSADRHRHGLSSFFLGLIFTVTMPLTTAHAALTTVPFITAPVPTLNGEVLPAEWKNALVLGGTGPDGSPATRFYIQHDGTALWVAAQCDEPRKQGPIAQVRGPEDSLAIDDTVEVALGLPGGNQREISMGGYEGASTGKVAPVAHLYEFMVNAAGSKVRKYDEAALPHARFEAEISRNAKGWAAEFRIPFESLGLKNGAGRDIYANFLRYRNSGTIAWRGMNRWGGYMPFPVSLLRLAASTDEPLQLAAEDKVLASSKPAAKSTESVEQGTVLPLGYYPLSNTVAGIVPLKAGESALLSAGGVTAHSDAAVAGVARIGLELPHRPAVGDVIEASLQTLDRRGQILKTESHTFTATETPAWAGSDAGREYLKDLVPRPWKAPQTIGNTVKLSHGNIVFANSALPSSISGADGELLGKPARIELWQAGNKLSVAWAKPSFSVNGVRPVVVNRGVFGASSIEVRTEVDYDGFMITQVRLEGKASAADRIQFIYPLKTKFAQYIAQGSVQTIIPVDAAGYHGEGGSRFWLGSESGGLAIASDLPFYQAQQKDKEIRIEQKGETRELTITPADTAAMLAPGTVLQFYMQPTPVRAPSTTSSDDYNLWFEHWSDYQGYPDLKKMPDVKQHSAESHSQGKKQLLYFNQLTAENAPEFKEYHNELLALPERNWYQRAYDPGKGVPCYVSCVKGPYGDLLLDGISKLADEGGIDGIYMDGTSVDWDCDTPSHLACDTHRRPVWGQPGETRIIGARNFLKRLRGIFDAKKKPFALVAHTGGGLDIHTLGLVDYFWEGEQLSRNLPQFRIPKYQFAIGYSGTPWGYRTQFFDFWLDGRGQNWSLAYTLIFNTDNLGGASRRLLRPFDGANASFHPYWKDGQQLLVKSRTERTSVSYYHAGQQVMVAATNFGFLPDEIELRVDRFDFIREANWIDILTGTKYTAANGKLRISLPPYHGVALRPVSQVAKEPTLVRYADPRISSTSYLYLPLADTENAKPLAPTVAAATQVPELIAMDLSNWKVNEEAGGVKRQDVAANGDSPAQLVLSSVPYQSEAQAWLVNTAIAGNAEVRLKFKSENKPVVRIEFGPVDITCSNDRWNVEGAFDGWNDKQVGQVPWREKEEVELIASILNDKLTVRLGDQLIVDGMKLDTRYSPARPLKIATWSDSKMTIQLLKLTSKPTKVFRTVTTHPVMP